jgi:uncharacterized protein
MMMHNGYEWLIIVALYSFGGWVLETAYASLRAGRWVNRGFLSGPFCPIYGLGAGLILLSSVYLENILPHHGQSRLALFLASIVLVSLLELIAGWSLMRIFQRRWWDYSANRWNIHGYVCALYSLLWGGLALVLTELIHPALVTGLLFVSPVLLRMIVRGLVAYTLVDCLLTIRSELSGMTLRNKTAKPVEEDFESCILDLLAHSEVQQMDDFLQHGGTTCLEHCLAVSRLSYETAKRLRLDGRSAARGALLHDFFLYDWHKSDPQRKWHGLSHPRTALAHADRCFDLNPVERDIILKHMWPLTPALPRYPESFLVLTADKYMALKETLAGLRMKLRSG